MARHIEAVIKVQGFPIPTKYWRSTRMLLMIPPHDLYGDFISNRTWPLPIPPEAPKPGLMHMPSRCLTGQPTRWTKGLPSKYWRLTKYLIWLIWCDPDLLMWHLKPLFHYKVEPELSRTWTHISGSEFVSIAHGRVRPGFRKVLGTLEHSWSAKTEE